MATPNAARPSAASAKTVLEGLVPDWADPENPFVRDCVKRVLARPIDTIGVWKGHPRESKKKAVILHAKGEYRRASHDSCTKQRAWLVLAHSHDRLIKKGVATSANFLPESSTGCQESASHALSNSVEESLRSSRIASGDPPRSSPRSPKRSRLSSDFVKKFPESRGRRLTCPARARYNRAISFWPCPWGPSRLTQPTGFSWSAGRDRRCRSPDEQAEPTLPRSSPRDPLSTGFSWASRVSTMALGFALPIVAGALIDQWLRSSPIGVLVGLVLGFIAGMTQILRVARTGTGGGNSPRDSS